jgi:RNA methyltransferase, TrmH family
MKTITSKANEEIKLVCALHDRKGREDQNRFIAEGLRTVTTLIKNRMKLMQLYTTEKNLSDAKNLANDSIITLVPETVMAKISAATSASGLLGVFEIPTQPNFSQLDSGIVLANITDPGNMGTLIRTASALNLKSVVIVDGVDVWSPKVVQSSAGTLAFINIFTPNWQTLVKWKKNNKLCALVVKGGKAPQDIAFERTLLVVGNEATGIPQEWLRDCEEYVTLAMPGKAESLNAAVAGSIAMYLAFGKYA